MSIDPKELKEYYRKIGAKGGKSTSERYGADHFRKISRMKKGMSWTWDPAKKGPRKAKSLQNKKSSAKIDPLTNKQ